MSFSVLTLAPTAVQALAPYVPGKPISELEREYGVSNSIKLASNENPLGPGAKARVAIADAVGSLGLYPDGSGFVLKQALSARHQCAPECITLGNGSNDVLVLLAEAFLDASVEAVYSQYCFAVYPLVVQATGAKAVVAPAHPEGHPMALGHDLNAMARCVTARTRLVFIANPNNPTGGWVDATELHAFVASVPSTTLVVIDEAYIEYASGREFADASRWLKEFSNLIVTRTFSKAYGLAGLRAGYALSNPEVAAVLNRVRQPFNVNSLALVGAAAALDDAEHLKRTVALNEAGLKQMQSGLTKLAIKHYPSVGNFILVDCGKPAAPINEMLLRQGVIVRPVGGYGLPNHLRLTIGTESENARLLDALAKVLFS